MLTDGFYLSCDCPEPYCGAPGCTRKQFFACRLDANIFERYDLMQREGWLRARTRPGGSVYYCGWCSTNCVPALVESGEVTVFAPFSLTS